MTAAVAAKRASPKKVARSAKWIKGIAEPSCCSQSGEFLCTLFAVISSTRGLKRPKMDAAILRYRRSRRANHIRQNIGVICITRPRGPWLAECVPGTFTAQRAAPHSTEGPQSFTPRVPFRLCRNIARRGRWGTTTKHGMSVSAWTRGDCASLGRPSAVAKMGKAKVLDWLLWFLVPIGLFLALLVILGLKFLRDLARNERGPGDDR
jgi:hypothetical protein